MLPVEKSSTSSVRWTVSSAGSPTATACHIMALERGSVCVPLSSDGGWYGPSNAPYSGAIPDVPGSSSPAIGTSSGSLFLLPKHMKRMYIPPPSRMYSYGRGDQPLSASSAIIEAMIVKN
uniref:Uncharacterized protein n=1 Tax=Ciona savignyi TaxID=51511 RepID=H2Z998_CIOSA